MAINILICGTISELESRVSSFRQRTRSIIQRKVTEGGVGPWDSHGTEKFHLRPTMAASTLVDIPVEILLDICRLVTPKDAVNLCMVTKLFTQ